MRKYQYDDAYVLIYKELEFMHFDFGEDEDAYARQLEYGRK